jgi:hypothetical protein
MAAPSVNLTIRDGGLGLALPGTGNIHVKLGASPLGDVNTIIPVTNPTDGQVQLGKASTLMDSTAFALAVGGQGSVRPGGVYAVVVNPTTYGSAGGVTHTGPGTGTMTVAVKPSAQVLIKCIAGGTSTTSTWQTSVDGGQTWSATWTAAATIILPRATFVTLAFGAGTAVTGDVVTVPTSGNPSLTSGTGTLIPTISSASPVDAYNVIVTITTGGALGVAMFTYSLDGGATTSAVTLVPGGGVFPLPDTGLVVTFAGTLTLGDTYSFTSTGASYSSTDLTNAWNALVGDSRQWFMAHVVGAASTVGERSDARGRARGPRHRGELELPLRAGADGSPGRHGREHALRLRRDGHAARLLVRRLPHRQLRAERPRLLAEQRLERRRARRSHPAGGRPGSRRLRRAARRALPRPRRVQDAGPRQRPLHDAHHHPRAARLLRHELAARRDCRDPTSRSASTAA